VRKQKH
jgi:hypothetical protein